MPELPEVEVVRRGLQAHVVGRRIDSAIITGPRAARRHLAGAADLADRLAGKDVTAARRRGKYLWLALAGREGRAQALVLHLGMSGQLLVSDAGTTTPRHCHAVLRFGDDGPDLRFVDPRTFGGLALAEVDAQGIPAPVAQIAADPFDPAFDQESVVRRLKARQTAIKRALLDQRLVSGIGNIYADEALWRAALHGERRASALTRPVLRRVLDHASDVMGEALEQGGTSFDAMYVNVNGASGYFDRSLNAYGQQGRPCARCRTPIRREEFMNRSSHYCPRCQPRPRATR